MSSLLEQAIIDATALKEAALKNAEAAVLEKYAPEIKKAVESLLEQEEDPFAMGAGMDQAMDAPVDADIDVPLAATEGENMCGCPDEEESVEGTIDFTKLLGDMDEDPAASPDEDQESLEAVMSEDNTTVNSLQEDTEVDLSDDLLDKILQELSAVEDEGAFGGPDDEDDAAEECDPGPPEIEEATTAPDDAAELSEEAIADIVEKLVVDMAATKSGWLGGSKETAVHETELELARAQDTEFQEENEALKKAVEELQEKLSNYDFTINEMKRKLDETNLTNARLLYANRILGSASLNERQKNKIVEAISTAGSVKEAKVIFETLQSTVGTSSDRRGPQSLREAVTRPSSIMSVRENKTKKADPVSERMQILAGIRK